MTHSPCVDRVVEEIALLQPVLLRLARQRLRNPAWADDAVSETILAALERAEAAADCSNTKAWLVGILKHKLVDQIRRHTRERQLDSPEDAPDHDPLDNTAAGWGDPQANLGWRQLIADIDRCLQALPPQQRQAFLLSDCLEQSTPEVCRGLGVNANHLGVILHRARHKLRTALAPNWAPASMRA